MYMYMWLFPTHIYIYIYNVCTYTSISIIIVYFYPYQVINGNIPYGDAFYVSCRFCMTRVAHNRTRLRVTSNICFRKNCWGVVKSNGYTMCT